MPTWLLDETTVASPVELSLPRKPATPILRGAKPPPLLAVRLNDVVIHNVRKWFGGADLRLDVVALHAPTSPGALAEQYYHPGTFFFPGVRDGQRLPVDEPGLLVFLGRPRLFLDLSILISRDLKDAVSLRELIAKRVGSKEWLAASGALLATAVAAPQAAIISGAVAGAVTLANLTAEILREAAGTTIGLYRVSYLQQRDRFGLGRHPVTGSKQVQDFSFWYDIVADEKPNLS